MPRECTFPGCGRPAVGRKLCAAHYRQQARGKALSPIRGPRGQLGDEPLVRLPGLRVSRTCAEAVRQDTDGARDALEKWSEKESKR